MYTAGAECRHIRYLRMLQGFLSWDRTGRKSLLRLRKAGRTIVSNKEVASSEYSSLQFV